jgi:hypothetical protein
MPEGKLSSSSPSETQNLDEQTIPPEVEIELPTFVGQVIKKIKIHQKKIFLGLALFLVILAVLGVANRVYWLGKWWFPSPLAPTPTPSLISTPTPNPTAGWQTYTSFEDGYLIKYPPTMSAEEAQSLVKVLPESYQRVISRLESEWWGGTKESPNRAEDVTVAGVEGKKVTGTQVATGKGLFETYLPRENRTYRIVFLLGPEEDLKDNEETFQLILSTFRFLTPENKGISFRIDEEDDVTKVVLMTEDGQERVLREYHWPETGRARRLDVSPHNQFLAVSQGTAHLGSLEIINLENEETVAILSEYGQVIWLDDHRLVLNAPETVDPPRPYEGGEGVSLVAFDAASNHQRFLKKADAITDYPLQRVENEEIFFEKRLVKEGNDWTNPKISYWKINFEGTVEMEVK